MFLEYFIIHYILPLVGIMMFSTYVKADNKNAKEESQSHLREKFKGMSEELATSMIERSINSMKVIAFVPFLNIVLFTMINVNNLKTWYKIKHPILYISLVLFITYLFITYKQIFYGGID